MDNKGEYDSYAPVQCRMVGMAEEQAGEKQRWQPKCGRAECAIYGRGAKGDFPHCTAVPRAAVLVMPRASRAAGR